ncbi:MAG: NUDIX domain-containing protein [Anaerolineales bacterium]|nr:NUDIX domain-containing protein [Anaerolineales bacterium]
MSKIGATVAIIKDGKILMTKRSDFEVWCLPGGHVDPGESVATAAIREAQEEVGLAVDLTRFVGVYSRLGGEYSIHLNLFTATPIGGTLTPQADEVLEISYFSPGALPDDMFWWHRQQIADAFAGVSGAAWEITVVPAEIVDSRPALYALQARSGLSPSEFYRYFFEKNGIHRIKRIL